MNRRRTSIYSLHISSPDRAEANRLLDDILSRHTVSDRGLGPEDGEWVLRVSFRAGSDMAARSRALDMMSGVTNQAQLTTNFGAHRREVWVAA